MNEQINRPRLHRNDYRNAALVFGAAFLGTLLALGLMMLFGKMMVKRQLKDLEKMADSLPEPAPVAPPVQKKVEVEAKAVEIVQAVEVKDENVELSPKSQAAKERPRLNGKFIKRQTIAS